MGMTLFILCFMNIAMGIVGTVQAIRLGNPPWINIASTCGWGVALISEIQLTGLGHYIS